MNSQTYISIDYAYIIQKNAIVIYPAKNFNFKNFIIQRNFNYELLSSENKIILTPGRNLIKLYNSHSKLFALIKLYAAIFQSLKLSEIDKIILILENSYYKKYLSSYAKLFTVKEIILELFDLCLNKNKSIQREIYYISKRNLHPDTLTVKKYKSPHITDALNFLEYYLNNKLKLTKK